MDLIEIEKLCRAKLWMGFPYKDLRKINASLSRKERKLVLWLNPDLDVYLGDIAGYATTATNIMNRSVEELRKALLSLDKDFFRSYPNYEFLQSRITIVETPDLFSQLEAAAVLRNELAAHIRKNLPD
jgi:hypothetical protein